MKYLIITDIGSTTTKALLLKEDQIIGYCNTPTTVEKPFEDVKIGVKNAIRGLEEKCKVNLLRTGEILAFLPEVSFLTTSSAGGGLQILVIGLTLFDSAASAQRTAYGAGGIILDTFAIDDDRSPLEQMRSVKNLHPDIILMTGGVDEGPVAPLLRLAELVTIAAPLGKFGTSFLPLVFAGNIKARSLLSEIFKDKFDFHTVDNIRPTMTRENHKPARDKIHELFLHNVMEKAPGYAPLKERTYADIMPTPLGVIRSLGMISSHLNKNIMAVDIGGATTDMFSDIFGNYFRTVSANLGMSYSLSNVLAEAGWEAVSSFLGKEFEEEYVRNYLANKTLYPLFIPQDDRQLAIEHTLARFAIQLAKKQHFAMNFRRSELGFLEKMKSVGLDKICDAFYYEGAQEREAKFGEHQFDIYIGAGGVISHVNNVYQALMLLSDGFQPKGIAEIWIDKNFISPHMGVLGTVNENLARQLLFSDCFEKIGLIIAPQAAKVKDNCPVLTINGGGYVDKELMPGEILYFPEGEKNIRLDLGKGYFLTEGERHKQLSISLPILIDTRDKRRCLKEEMEIMPLYNFEQKLLTSSKAFAKYTENKQIEEKEHTLARDLPYVGTIKVELGEIVTPQTVLGENLYDPPKIYVLTLFDKSYLQLTSENIKESLRVSAGEKVDVGQIIVQFGDRTFKDEITGAYRVYESPVRGIIEQINCQAGTIILREIQDYDTSPVIVDIAKELQVRPTTILPYLKRRKGDFVYTGDLLASRLLDKDKDGNFQPLLVKAPSTGTISEIDTNSGTLTLQFFHNTYRLEAGVCGKITQVRPLLGVDISFKATRLTGIIGFGPECYGVLAYLQNIDDLSTEHSGKIVALHSKISLAFLKKSADLQIKGIIAPAMDNKDLACFLGKELGVILTGNEKLPFALILTEGFGTFFMHALYDEFLKCQDGSWCYMDGRTQVRAGVIRPFVYILQQQC